MNPAVTARDLGLRSCHSCRRLSPKHKGPPGRCPYCGAHLRFRKRHSVSRCWGFLLGAFILYLPANLLPITRTVTMGRVKEDTIMSGVSYFFATGMWPLALIIFIASVFIPLAKMVTLAGLLLSVQLRSTWRPVDRTHLYRWVEVVGRWSMVDIYVVTILVALVKLGAVASVDAGPAALFFALVVILTVLAAESFDPRLIWDCLEKEHG